MAGFEKIGGSSEGQGAKQGGLDEHVVLSLNLGKMNGETGGGRGGERTLSRISGMAATRSTMAPCSKKR
jgi:hypothetical protein